MEDVAAAIIRGRGIRIDSDGLLIIANGPVVVILLEIRLAAAGIGNRVFRIEADRLVKVLDRGVEVALGGIGTAAAKMGDRVIVKKTIIAHCLVVMAD